jgi:hypothetical protein
VAGPSPADQPPGGPHEHPDPGSPARTTPPRSTLTGGRPVRFRAGPFPGDQSAVPLQHGAGRDESVFSQPGWQVPDKGARTAGSAQSSRGRGWVRRSTATSCRTRVVRCPWRPTNDRAGQSSGRAERRSGRAGEGAWPTITSYGLTLMHHPSSQTQPDFRHPTGLPGCSGSLPARTGRYGSPVPAGSAASRLAGRSAST